MPNRTRIKTSLSGSGYARVIDIDLGSNDSIYGSSGYGYAQSRTSNVNFDEVMRQVCRAWGITRPQDDLCLQYTSSSWTFLITNTAEWTIYQEVSNSSYGERPHLYIGQRPKLPAWALNVAEDSTEKSTDAAGDASGKASIGSASATKPAASTKAVQAGDIQGRRVSESSATDIQAHRDQREDVSVSAAPARISQSSPAPTQEPQQLLDRATREAITFGATLGRDVAGAFTSLLNERLGRTGPLPTSGTEVAQAVVSAVEHLLSGGRPAVPDATPHGSSQATSAPTSGSTQVPNAVPRDSAGSSGAREDNAQRESAATSAEDGSETPLTEYERLMARSRAQGEALNAFFGTITERRAEGLRGRHPRAEALAAEEASTGTPPSEPLRETSPTQSGGPSGNQTTYEHNQPQSRIATQNARLEDLWEQRLAQMGHALPENQTYLSQFPSSSMVKIPGTDQQSSAESDSKSWELLRDDASADSLTSGVVPRPDVQAGQAASKQDEGAPLAGAGPVQAALTTQEEAGVEEQNKSLAEAFSEMLARSRGEKH
ncbi:unnamed protein product [Parajaminaea phylloscopi]